MKILFALDDFPPITYTGASVVAFGLAREFLNRGHEVFIITSVQDRTKEGEEIYNGMKIFRIYSKYNIRWRFWINMYNPQIISKFKKIIKEIKPDICHFHHIHQYLSYHCLKIAKKYSKAVFITAHDVMFFHYGKLMPKNGSVYYGVSVLDQIKEARKRYNPFRNLLIRHYLKCANKIFTVSNALKEVLKINRIKNVETIHNGIDVNEWRVDENSIKNFRDKYNIHNKKIILFGGRISGAKGGDVMLQAMVLVANKINDVVLLVVGKNDFYLPQMIKSSKGLGINNNVKFVGQLDRREMMLAFFASDICVTPSICFDPFPTVNLEAMAAKKPVVGTCFGGTPEIIIDNQSGYIVNPLDTKELSEKIIDLLKNPQKAKRFGEAGHQRVKEFFSLEGQAEKTLGWYKKFTNICD